ncbi:UTP--glucose-1-phosphate uridylyltransferase GalU [Nakamurella antarctica]|uniref:UTP--glucose-1-phosphate uridylyltransferase GalU n=1 Tax=Nakamurella antarctica TaxID=1902245 RepID=UPI001EF11E14|nr:UTP--glucose-1-phosphate uridylyltransferase GalU [Nakamurella antarctica]
MASQHTVTKAVIPAAGLGTRFLPATKAVPKEMLPVVDKPAIQYVVEEAVNAGLSDILMISGRNKRALEDHFDRNFELETLLKAKGEDAKLALVNQSSELATINYVRQGDAKGLGHAVLCAEQHVGRESFAVLLGDDLIDVRDELLASMIAVHEATGQSVIALIEVPPSQIGMYGCAAVAPLSLPLPEELRSLEVSQVTALVEKPDPASAPSNLAVIGRYVLTPQVFDVLHETEAGRGGEIQLTDALATLMDLPPAVGGGIIGIVFRGRRYDTGDKLDYLKTIVTLASEREDLGVPFTDWLKEFIAEKG